LSIGSKIIFCVFWRRLSLIIDNYRDLRKLKKKIFQRFLTQISKKYFFERFLTISNEQLKEFVFFQEKNYYKNTKVSAKFNFNIFVLFSFVFF
jgi:hypothetical protein